MDTQRTKSTFFMAGLVTGIAVAVLVGWLVSPPGNHSITLSKSVDKPLRTSENVDSPEPELGKSAPQQTGSNGEPKEAYSLADRHSVPNDSLSSVGDSVTGIAVSSESLLPTQPIPISDAHAEMLQSSGGKTGGRASKHAEIEAEPNDDNWSYFMEQSVTIFLSQHQNAELFSVFNIECRTTLCEIQVIGFDQSTSPDWHRILFDLGQQSWYDFGEVGTSYSEYQGQLAIVTHLTRRMSDSG